MTVKASMRPALILATGLLLCLAAPSYAAPDTDDAAATTAPESAAAPVALHKNAKQGARHWKKYTHRRSSKVALKPSVDKKSSDDKAPDNKNPVAPGDSDHSSAVPPLAIPPSVANANAQLAPADTPTGDAAMAMTARANDILQAMPPQKPADARPPAETQVVAADQLNDVDRALRESTPPAPTPAVAPAEPPATAPVAPVVAGSDQSSSWDQTSLIGKIFITFGALLTMASAARMFMA